MSILIWRYLRNVLTLLMFFCFSGIAYAADLEPLPIDQAFALSAWVKDEQTVVVQWQVAPTYYLYRDRIHIVPVKDKGIQLGPLILPEGKPHYHPSLGHYLALEGSVRVVLPVLSHLGDLLSLKVSYQGCSSLGFCYPPTDRILILHLRQSAHQVVHPVKVEVSAEPKPSASITLDEPAFFEKHHGPWILLAFLGYGILISLTPCVLPMIPILSSIIVGQGRTLHHWRSFFLSLSYVLGMAITYAVIGMFFGLLGSNIQVALQTPPVLLFSALVFVLLALSMFGYYDIQLPARLQTWLHHSSDRQKRGSYIGVVLMGALSSLILSPCVTPPLVGALGFISKTGSASLGAGALFALGLGMGFPLLIIGATGARWLPKAGPWMSRIKQILGFLLLAVAILLVDRIAPAWVSLWLWMALILGASVALGAFRTADTLGQWLAKSLGILGFIYVVVLGVGLYQGQTRLLQPILRLGNQEASLAWHRVTTVEALNQALMEAKRVHWVVLLDYYAAWCIACKQMDSTTFQNPSVQKALSSFYLIQVDITANDAESKMLSELYGVIAPPTLVFLDETAQSTPISRIVGEVNAETLLKKIEIIKSRQQPS